MVATRGVVPDGRGDAENQTMTDGQHQHGVLGRVGQGDDLLGEVFDDPALTVPP